MHGFIRMFEPLVIRAMNQYTSTSAIPLQQQILFLLSRLLSLRIVYKVLDDDGTFIVSIMKQVELIENGHLRNAHHLLSYLFQFLSLLAQEHNIKRFRSSFNLQRIKFDTGIYLEE